MFTILTLKYAFTPKNLILAVNYICYYRSLLMVLRTLTLFIAPLMAAVMLLVAGGCRKSERDEDLEVLSAKENALAHHIFDDAFREIHRFAMRDSLLNDTGIKQWFDDCIDNTILSDTVAVFPLYLSINYGDKGIVCNDGFKRYGVINAAFSGKYLNKNTEIIIGFDGYRKDIFDVEGVITIQNLGLNEDNKRYYEVVVEDALITGSNVHIDWSGTFIMTWITGTSTQGMVDDDVFHIQGYCGGRNTRGNTFYNTINSDYVSDLGCQWFVSGQSTLEVANLQTRHINYGDGSCDNVLTEVRDNTTLSIQIPY